MNWQACRQKVLEWGAVAMLAAVVQHWFDFQELKRLQAVNEVYINLLWEESRKK